MLPIKKSARRVTVFVLAGALLAGLAGIGTAATRFEHVAINVENPKAVADWYVKYVGLKIVSQSKKMIFVSDQDGHFMFELYHKPGAKGSFADMNHAATHVAFAVDDAETMAKRMVDGGAKRLGQKKNPVGDTVIDMLDPWGNMLQVIHRVRPKL